MFAEIYLALPVDKPFHYLIPELLMGAVAIGMRVEVPFGSRKAIGYVVKLSENAPVENVKEILSVVDNEEALSPKMFLLAQWLSKEYLCSYGEALACIVPASIKPPKRAAKPIENQEQSEIKPSIQPALSTAQNEVIQPIVENLESGTFQAFCLHGITSSGKTEVYLASIEKALALNRYAIYVLPEISLTPQFIAIVQARFPGKVGIWHSKLTGSKRYRTWDDARNGKIKIMLGARSAIFAPFSNIGVIIIDEEHEPTYKQDKKPFYQTREVALAQARLHNASLIFGSATPSLEVYYRAQQGEFTLLEMHERIDQRQLPSVELVDLSTVSRKARVITPLLHTALSKILAKREQAIIFLNRRGFSPGVVCSQCGNTWQCTRCSISLVYHKTTNDLRCHYCGYAHPWPGVCPTCKNRDLSVFGIGTQKVEHELKALFPQARVFRLDRDTASTHAVYHKAYEDFKAENYDILLGTQMVAKGFDFPRVTLVGVIDADTALQLPDFRSAERTFQLITQVAGRSGRSDLGGEVVVQTNHPGHYALVAAQKHDYERFYAQEIEYRKQMKYPPFTRLVNVLVRAGKEEKAVELSKNINNDLVRFRETKGFSYEILGPTPAAHSKIRRQFRYQVLLKGKAQEVLSAAESIRNFYLPKGIFITIDVDPHTVL